MDQTVKYCPCCGRHCDLSAPHCQRGEEYARTGVIPEGHSHQGPHRDHGEKGHHGEFHGQQVPEEDTRKKDRYAQQDLDSKILWNLRDLGHALRHQAEGKGSQKRILMLLEELGPVSQSELTRTLGIQPGSASEVLGKLETAGLILRTPSEKDRRTTLVSLTNAGKTEAAEAGARRKQRHMEQFGCLTEEEKATLLPLLEKLNGAWRQREKEMPGHHHGKPHHEHGHGPHKGHHRHEDHRPDEEKPVENGEHDHVEIH